IRTGHDDWRWHGRVFHPAIFSWLVHRIALLGIGVSRDCKNLARKKISGGRIQLLNGEVRVFQICPCLATISLMAFRFELLNSDGKARRGRLHTAHGSVETPVFMAVGTQASVKGLTPTQLEDARVQVVLGNTYHLALRPGDELIAELGGLHRFMGWNRPILTDSGGFQVYSLAASRKIDDRAAVFRSHIDGALFELTPERAV